MSAILPVSAARSPWPAAGLAAGSALAVVLLCHASTFAAMVAIWERSDTFAHAFLVAPISLWLVWRRRAELATMTPRPGALWLLPLAAMAFLWLAGDLAGVNAVTQFAVVAMLVLVVPALLGTAVANAIAFPLLFLFFMVPVGEFAMPRMMEWTADFTVASLQLVGVPVYREGLQFTIPTGNWSVVEACSGVRYLIASFMVGVLFAYLNYRSTKRRVVFAIVSLLVPIVANGLRAFIVVMLGHLSGNRLATGVDHLIYGWVFFGIVVAIMFGIGARWSEPEQPPAPPPARDDRGTVAASSALLAGVLVVVALLAALPDLASARLQQGGRDVGHLELPALAGTTDTAADIDYAPVFENPAAETKRSYAFEGQVVTAHLAYYRHQGYGRKLGNSQNVLVKSNDQRWHVVASGPRVVQVDGAPVTTLAAEVRPGRVSGDAGGGQATVELVQLFWVDGHLTTSPTWATVYALASQLRGRGDDGAALTLYLSGTDAAAARRTLDAFVARHLPEFTRFLATTREAR